MSLRYVFINYRLKHMNLRYVSNNYHLKLMNLHHALKYTFPSIQISHDRAKGKDIGTFSVWLISEHFRITKMNRSDGTHEFFVAEAG